MQADPTATKPLRRLSAAARDLLDAARRRPRGPFVVTASELAREAGTARATVTRCLGELVRRGLVTREHVHDGGRPIGMRIALVESAPLRVEDETDRRQPRAGVQVTVGGIAAALGSTRGTVGQALNALVERRLVLREYVTKLGRPFGVRLQLLDAPMLLDETEADEDLDAYLLDIISNPDHPRHLDANAAYLFRHGRDRGWTGIEPPRTKEEFDTAWPPKLPSLDGLTAEEVEALCARADAEHDARVEARRIAKGEPKPEGSEA